MPLEYLPGAEAYIQRYVRPPKAGPPERNLMDSFWPAGDPHGPRHGKDLCWVRLDVALIAAIDQLASRATPHFQGSMDSTAIGRLLTGEMIAE
jgi:hypothetical protein